MDRRCRHKPQSCAASAGVGAVVFSLVENGITPPETTLLLPRLVPAHRTRLPTSPTPTPHACLPPRPPTQATHTPHLCPPHFTPGMRHAIQCAHTRSPKPKAFASAKHKSEEDVHSSPAAGMALRLQTEVGAGQREEGTRAGSAHRYALGPLGPQRAGYQTHRVRYNKGGKSRSEKRRGISSRAGADAMRQAKAVVHPPLVRWQVWAPPDEHPVRSPQRSCTGHPNQRWPVRTPGGTG